MNSSNIPLNWSAGGEPLPVVFVGPPAPGWRPATEDERKKVRGVGYLDRQPNAARNVFGVFLHDGVPLTCGCGGSMFCCHEHARQVVGDAVYALVFGPQPEERS